MIRIWATVQSWQHGVAVVQCQLNSSCAGCQSRSNCAAGVVGSAATEHRNQLQLTVAQPLRPGQQVELGLVTTNLLRSAALVYITPLLGLLFGAALLQWQFDNDIAALCGAIFGGSVAFLLARYLAPKLSKRGGWQPVLLQVLPLPNSSRVAQESHPPHSIQLSS
ncbi:SoxR reducing system RseC family protein [Serratia microhaemolytica]|uniref:SoxR reducing system RseC family protein n=1 Tax=Serratia microhaemolytica TaxID=2675110 RepID=UPI000FDD49FD|nr:SoxR reducing system RseC family protein [Serratia microhaemolytica]